MIRRPPRSTLSSSSAASDVYKRQDKESRRDEINRKREARRKAHEEAKLKNEKYAGGDEDTTTTSPAKGPNTPSPSPEPTNQSKKAKLSKKDERRQKRNGKAGTEQETKPAPSASPQPTPHQAMEDVGEFVHSEGGESSHNGGGGIDARMRSPLGAAGAASLRFMTRKELLRRRDALEQEHKAYSTKLHKSAFVAIQRELAQRSKPDNNSNTAAGEEGSTIPPHHRNRQDGGGGVLDGANNKPLNWAVAPRYADDQYNKEKYSHQHELGAYYEEKRREDEDVDYDWFALSSHSSSDHDACLLYTSTSPRES
eukprot:TRINITY_DN49875_c0_g1_i2.p1 TRINITY_DN49875_c0_g1~~TRINITY_DN49875_c0_g1_i2.p1  ORF type:complete len:311 (+),score=78.28 TRINITY_DN49875_c0_g1_i2:121-1053(+)